MKKLFQLLVIMLPFSTYAEVKLSALFGDDMILQQNTMVNVWGSAQPNEVVRVQGSWMQTATETRADATGVWKVQIPTPKAGTGFTLTINEHVLKNVAIGEVWICSGQSNMEWTPRQGLDDVARAQMSANFPNIRAFTVQRNSKNEAQTDVSGKWSPISPESMMQFSSVAYFFGKMLHQELNVPIGLINTSWGGTPAEAWMSESALRMDQRFAHLAARANNPQKTEVFPTSLYKGMVEPLIPFKMAGVIWYQGESNTSDPYLYRTLFPALIADWRSAWGNEFPFYYVQIAPYQYSLPYIGALVQEAQRMTLAKARNVGMVVTTDIGNPKDIHPTNKQDVGKRLALWALAKHYQKADFVGKYSGALYQKMRIEGNKIRVYFDEFDGRLAHPFPLTHFYVAGADKRFYPAFAEFSRKELLVYSPNVPNPVAVRFGFDNIAEPNFRNRNSLPASPFRTDDWALITTKVAFKLHLSEGDPQAKMELLKEGGGNTNTNVPQTIYYTTDGSEPIPNVGTTAVYTTSFPISKAFRIKARVVDAEGNLGILTKNESVWHLASYVKPQINVPLHGRYNAGGVLGLTDGVIASNDYNDGKWQGYEGTDLEMLFDLKEIRTLNKIETHFLQQQNAWIFLPKEVKFLISEDGNQFEEAFSLQQNTSLRADQVESRTYKTMLSSKKARYIKIVAKSMGACPDWHGGAGGKSWLFVDEVIVE